ncbi:MAG: hypothetical protein QXM52_02840 [Candidatus Bathyarchaeia archaeon]
MERGYFTIVNKNKKTQPKKEDRVMSIYTSGDPHPFVILALLLFILILRAVNLRRKSHSKVK